MQYVENEFFKTGKDIVKFYITTNLGEDEKNYQRLRQEEKCQELCWQ